MSVLLNLVFSMNNVVDRSFYFSPFLLTFALSVLGFVAPLYQYSIFKLLQYHLSVLACVRIEL